MIRWLIISIIILVLIFVYYIVRINYERGSNWKISLMEFKSLIQTDVHDSDRFHIIKNTPKGFNFNPGIIVYNSDTQSYSNYLRSPRDSILITFRNSRLLSIYIAKTFIGRLDINTYELMDIKRTSDNPDGKHEDMRFFCYDNRLYGSFTKVWSSMNPFNTFLLNKQGIYDIAEQKEYIPRLNYAKSEGQFEKNWQFFQDGSEHLMIYMVQPFTVYKVNPNTFETESLIQKYEWQSKSGIVFRCSTPPIWINDRWYMMIHSKDYRMYFMTFSKEYIPLQYSEVPVCESERCKYVIYFPCGCIYDTNREIFIISLGINNAYMGILEVPKKEIDATFEYC